MPKQLPLYFLHIPKVAGTSVIAALDALFQPAEIFPPQLVHDALPLPREQIHGYRFYRGHFGLSLLDVIPTELDIFTIVRQPHEHAISYYHHIQRSPAHWLYPLVSDSRMSFAEFLEHPATAAAITNLQSRNLALPVDFTELQQLSRGEQQAYRFIRNLDERVDELSPAQLFTAARQTLDRCLCVGLTEQLDESLRRLTFARGMQPPAGLQQLNATPSRLEYADLLAHTRDRLLELTEVDRQLYEYAQAKFLADTPRYGQAA